MFTSLDVDLPLSCGRHRRFTEQVYNLMLVLLAEQVIACGRIVFAVILQAIEQILLWITKFIFYLADNEVVNLLLIIRNLDTRLLRTEL